LSLLDKKIQGVLIIFENLTSGLSQYEYPPLAELLHQLSGTGNTVVVIDQNTFFAKISHHQIEF
jgi:excinuclease UvrABC ATPase subunit